MSNPPVPLTIRDQYPHSTPTEPIYRRYYLDDVNDDEAKTIYYSLFGAIYSLTAWNNCIYKR